MEVIGVHTTLFGKDDSLMGFLYAQIPSVHEGDIIVITSKIVALSEGRVASVAEKSAVIRKESEQVIETPWAFLTRTGDEWGINAGVDESNADGELILMPKDSFRSAEKIHTALCKKYKLKKLGVLITDTRSSPLRVGTTGRAVGFAGFKPLKSYIGKKDLYGRKSRVTISNVADALAAVAVVVMGEGSEQVPIVIIRGVSVEFTDKKSVKKKSTLSVNPQNDIFSYIFRSMFQ